MASASLVLSGLGSVAPVRSSPKQKEPIIPVSRINKDRCRIGTLAETEHTELCFKWRSKSALDCDYCGRIGRNPDETGRGGGNHKPA